MSLSPGGNREARACSRAEDFSGEQDHFDYTSEKLRNCVVNKRFEKDSGKTWAGRGGVILWMACRGAGLTQAHTLLQSNVEKHNDVDLFEKASLLCFDSPIRFFCKARPKKVPYCSRPRCVPCREVNHVGVPPRSKTELDQWNIIRLPWTTQLSLIGNEVLWLLSGI